MRNINFNLAFKAMMLFCFIVLSTSGVKAQLTGIKNIPGDYPTIAAFVTDVNSVGVGPGGVTVNVAAGHSEAAVGVIALTASGTASNPILIQKSGAGANPIITSYTGGTGTPGTAVQDGIFALVGSDYVTIDGIDLTENALNTTNPSTMEYGYGFFKGSVTDGCQFNVIRNCVITLNRVNNAAGTSPAFDGSRGINVVNSLIGTQTTAVTPTAASGSNSNNQFYANTIQNANIGIALSGFAASSPFTLSDTGNDVGGSALVTGNTIINFGGAPTATNPSAGIRTSNQQTLNVSYNTVNNNNGSGVDHVSTLRGIFIGASTSANSTINNNTIVLRSGATTSLLAGIDNASGSTAASNTININSNLIQLAYPTSTSAIVNAIINSGTANIVNINSNTIEGIAATFLAGTGTLVMIETGTPTTANTNNNIIRNINRNAPSGSWRIIKTTSPGTWIANGNLIENLSWTNTASTGSIDAIYSLSSAVNVTYQNNIIRNLSTPTTGTINGLREFGVSGTKLIQNNEIYNFSTTAGGAGGATFNGISVSTGTISIIGNKVYALNSTGTTGGTGGGVNGILCSGGTSCSVSQNKIYDLSSTSTNPVVAGISFSGGGANAAYNNTISDLRTPAANAANPLIGINFTSGTSGNAFYNSVLLNGTSSGALFGSSAVSASTSVALVLGNNIFINLSTPNGATGFTVAYRRSGTTLTSYNNVSNRNLFYAGTPSANQLLMYDGTNSYQTILAYQTAVAPRDLNSFTGEAFAYTTPGSFFISLTGSSTDFLKPVAGITSQVESGATNITTPIAITTDFASVIRAGNGGYTGTGTNPDLGAFEFEGISPAPVITLNSVTPPATTLCVTAARLVSVNIITASGTITGANLVYAINGTPQTPIAMTNPSGTTWEATIPASVPVNATITWGVTATNSIGLSSSYTGTPYADEPLTGSVGLVTASNATVCSGSPSTLTASFVERTIGAGALITTASGTSTTNYVSPFTHYYGGYKAQYIILASELTSSGLTAGNISSVAFDVTTAGTTYNGFSVAIGATASSSMTTTFINTGLNTVFSGNYNVASTGLNRINFATPYAWDGVSNIVIQLSWSNNNGGGIAAEVRYDATPFVAMAYYRADNQVPAAILAAGTATATLSNRPKMVFTTAPAITAVSWSDGIGTVGTTNPLVVNPTATTTYTATITAGGCTATANTTITVNPLPTAPTAANSAQCGTQIPTASVTSTTGLPTPTFIWYDAAVAGSVMQNSTSTTYTSNVATTTTFYVSELNTATGCESARTPVTVTVATADGVSASTSAATICIGSSITLTAANTNPTPNQSYTYSWSSTANSGASTPVAGSPAIITPTQPGTYTYDLAAVDGGCNAIASVVVTVDPFTATLAPINVTCNGYNNGSFSVSGSSCGTMPYTYSVGGGAFGAIPTNLAPGTYSVEVQDNNGYLVAAQNVVITEPSTTIAAPTGTNAAVCQGDLNAPVSATSLTNSPTPQTLVVGFNLAAQPAEANAAPGNVISSATMAALPAGAVVTAVTLAFPGTISIGGSYQSEIRLGVQGAANNAAAAGTGSAGANGAYDYTRALPVGSVNIAGGTIDLLYWNAFNDETGADATFPTGTSVATLTINYTIPTPASITWWDAASAGTQIGSGSPFETVGTSVLPNTNTPGVYTVYAQGEFGGCNGMTRTPVTVTVNAPSASTTTITACASYTWTNGTTYTVSGTHIQTLVNAVGCDSIATLNLTINQPTSSTVTVSACSSYTWAENNATYTTSGSYPVVLAGANANGCDSTVTLVLTINQPTSSTVTVSACNSYTWAENNATYTASGSYPVVLAGANANGCDSTVTLVLTINQPTSSTITVSACSSYTWAENNATYTTSGSYPVVLAGANANGCDSTVTLVLTINQPTSSSVSVTACGSYTWAENNTTYTASGSYPVVLAGANANGCDSTVTLVLTINQPTSSSVSVTACESYTWAENNTTYTASGSYPVVLAGANANGCDSTVTLVLTINQPTSSTVTATACESYTWAENNTTYTASGSYPVVLAGANANGCDSTVTLVLTITGLPTATATDNGDATITASAGTSYQWINCATNTAIAGATSQTYTATANGDYAVVVTNAGGCSDTSSCVNIDYIGLTEITDASIQVFPNPTNNDVTITMTAAEATVEVVDAQGKLLQAVTVGNGEKVTLSSYETGVYFLRIRTANGSTLERVVKQ